MPWPGCSKRLFYCNDMMMSSGEGAVQGCGEHLRARPRHHDRLAGDAAGLVPQHGLARGHVKLAQPIGICAGRLGSHAVRIPVLQALAPESTGKFHQSC